MDTIGTIGTPASMAARTYPVLPLKSITFCDSVGRIASKSPPGNTITAASEASGRGFIAAGRNEPDPLKELLGRLDRQDVVAERVEPPVVTEPVVEVHREGRQVRQSAGVVGDQRSAGRDAAEVPDLGTEVAFGDWPQEADDAFGQHRVPFGDPRPRQVRALASGSDGTAISVTNLREKVMLS